MKAIDTNILIRFITKDNENQAKLVYQLFKQAEQTEQKLFVPLLVVLEVIWVLQSIYEILDLEIVKTLSDLLAMPVLLFESESVIQNFIDSATHTKFYLSDLLIAHSIDLSNCESIFLLVPKLQLGNPVSKALALRLGKLELPRLHSQAGAWERAHRLPVAHDLHIRLERALREHKIVIPFPQRDVHLRTIVREHDEGKQGMPQIFGG